MNQNLSIILNHFGIETVIARLMEQLHMIVGDCSSQEAQETAKALLESCGCDTEYIYTLCENTNLVTYVSDCVTVTDEPWLDDFSRQCVEDKDFI